MLKKVHCQDFGLLIQFFWYVTPRRCAVSCLRSETTRLDIQTSAILVGTAAKNTKLAQTRTALFWVVTQRVVVISYRRFETTYRSYSLRNNTEERIL